MRVKKACLIVDLRGGQHVTEIPGLVSVLAAAGWKTDISLKAYGGESIQLARKAARKKYDLVISYGGDGSLNAVFNGVMYANGKSIVADLPGGTYNVWAGATGVPTQPVKAALALVDSEARMIDLGHLEATGLTDPNTTPAEQAPSHMGKTRRLSKRAMRTRHYFLLNVGMGMDADMMAHISKPLKYRFGPLAFNLATVKELPKQRPFPVEVQQLDDQGHVEAHWQGEIWQLYVSKVPLFGGSINIDPGSRADDGLIYVCLVTANGPLKTVEQVVTMLTQHKLDKESTQYLRGKHFSIRVPASTPMHVDGSIVELNDLLPASQRRTLQQQQQNADQMLVEYRFDISPKAVQIAVPRAYNGPLFATTSTPSDSSHTDTHTSKNTHQSTSGQTAAETAEQPFTQTRSAQQKPAYRATVIGTTTNPEKSHYPIIACNYKKLENDETQVIAVRLNQRTRVLNQAGEGVSATTVLELQEGQEILVEGEKTRRGVIKATCIRLP